MTFFRFFRRADQVSRSWLEDQRRGEIKHSAAWLGPRWDGEAMKREIRKRKWMARLQEARSRKAS